MPVPKSPLLSAGSEELSPLLKNPVYSRDFPPCKHC